jgi:hypothetical protein
MISVENLIILAIAIAAIAGVGYFLFNKINTQHTEMTTEITQLKGRLNNLESIFMRPPTAEIESVFEKPQCTDGICTFTPLKKAKQNDLDKIAEEEIAELEKEESEPSEKKKD